MNASNPKSRAEGIFISGRNLNLTILTEKDVLESRWYDWFNDEETTLFMQKHYFPNTLEMQMQYYKSEINSSDTKLQLGMRTLEGGPIFGVVSLNAIDYINHKAEIAMVIGDKNFRKTVYALEGTKLMVEHGFNSLNLHRIYGGTIINEYAEMLCRSFGFAREGTLRSDVFKNGLYVDVQLIGLLREEWSARKNVR